MIQERLEKFRSLMKEKGIHAYMVPTSDFHETEYVGDHFKARTYMSGFTGSSGTLIIALEDAALWTDGRYFIQAAAQLEGSGITLMKMGEPKTPTMVQYLLNQIPENGVLGFDGRVINSRLGNQLKETLGKHGITILADEDLVDAVWTDRPGLPDGPAFLLDSKYTGKDASEKLADVREIMTNRGCDAHIITSLDDIAWLFNLRGSDIECYPVVLAYALLTRDSAKLYLDDRKLNADIRSQFAKMGVEICEYSAIYEDVKTVAGKIMLDGASVNYAIYQNLNPDQILDCANPTQLMKAIKNETELNNTIDAHIKDGVAFTKFMYWLKTNISRMEISEISASDYLEACRREQEGFLDLSFNTISAYKDHAAMMHYSADEESNAVLKQEGMLLVDSGGQYYQGTTDITRTMALGPLSDKLKTHFTAVLRSMINLAKARFLYGCRGVNLDILARGPIWDLNIDYRCGTGHGVGHVLNVHESPNGFRWKIVPERNDSCVLEEGMITTDEPGIYLEGSHGIRIENELITRKGEANEYGQFMHFQTITVAPIDLDAIDAKQLNAAEKAWLNDYHKHVYDTLAPYLDEAIKTWLKEYTRAI